MSDTSEPDDDELIVKARFFAPIEQTESKLNKMQQKLTEILLQEGYRQDDPGLAPFGPAQRTMDFYYIDGLPIEQNSSIAERVKDFFKSGRNDGPYVIGEEEYLEALRKLRDDIPFQYVFYFKSNQDDVEGYTIEAECTPALLQKYRSLNVRDDYEYNINNVVNENKRELKRIMGKIGLEPLDEPKTEKEIQIQNRNMTQEPGTLFSRYRVTAQLNAITEPDSQLYQDYQKAVREFRENEYEDCVRDIGRAAELLIELLCEDLYGKGDIPTKTGGRIDKLGQSDDGTPSYIGKTVSPLWWLRNKANHPTSHDLSKEDAHFALLCFQVAMEAYTEDFKNTDVIY
jgi:hypothetical protein